MRSLRLPLLLLVTLTLSSCAGYRLGGTKPAPLADVHSLHVAFFKNMTLFPRAEVTATNAAVHAIVADGTYSVTTENKADAVLEAKVHSIDYAQVSSSRIDSLRSEELEMRVRIDWTVHGGSPTTRLLAAGTSTGLTRFFVDPNLQTARNNALADAMDRAAQSMVSKLANGW